MGRPKLPDNKKSIATIMAEKRKETKRQKKMEELKSREWYVLRSILGFVWAIFIFLLGGREVGKSYAVTDTYTNQWKKYKRPFIWLRLSETSAKKLLANN